MRYAVRIYLVAWGVLDERFGGTFLWL